MTRYTIIQHELKDRRSNYRLNRQRQAAQSSVLDQVKKEQDRKKDQEAQINTEREDAEARKA